MGDPQQLPQQANAYTAEGAPIAPEDMAAAVREGRGFFQKGAKVYARNPDGDLVTVAPEDAHLPGYSVITPAELHESRLKREAESTSGLVKTGGEGLARGGASLLGLGGPEMLYDAEGRENARARKRYNPNLAAGSELAGATGAALATSLLTGGLAAPEAEGSLAALAARSALTPFRAATALADAAEGGAAALGAGEGIVGSALRMGASGAVQGGLMGAGHEVSQASLDNVPLTAERLLAGAWDGAKMGGAFGAGLGALSAGVGKVGRGLIAKMSDEGSTLEDATGTWAENATFKQHVGNNGKIWDQATNFGQDMARPARIGRKLLDADMPVAPRAALARAGELTTDAFKRMEGVVQAVDEAGVMANPESILNVVDDQISKIREVPFGDAQAVADRIEKNIAPFRERFGPKVVAREATPLARGPGGSFAGPESVLAPELAPPEQIKLSELWELRKQLDKSINFETRTGGQAKEALMDMRDAFRSELDATVQRAAEASDASPDLLAAWKQASEDYGDMALIKKSLKQLINRQSKNRGISASDYGAGGAAGILMGVLSGNAVTGMVGSAITSGVHKLIRERGLGVMAKIADRSGFVANQMESAGALAALTGKASEVAVPSAVNVGQQFAHYSKLLDQAKNDPVKFSERLGQTTADLSIRFPEVANQIQKTMLADLAYLDQLHPTPSSRRNATLTPAAIKAPVYAFDQQKAFVDAAMALDNPVGVFQSLAHGDLPLAGLNALKERRPELFGEMRQIVIKHTMKREQELPFNRRMLLGVSFDFPSDWSLLNIGQIQESLLASEGPTSKNDPTAAPSKLNTDPGKDIAPATF